MKKNLALLLLGTLMSLPAFANLTADPIILSFAGTEDARKDIKVGNSSNRPQYLEISASRITELGIFPETYFDSADPAEVGLLVAPRRIVLQPGEEKVIRVILLDREIETDKAWRVNISPVIGDINADKSVAVTMIGFKALVFARPDEPQSNIVGARDGQTLTLSNIGNTNVVLFDGEQCPVSETAVETKRDSETETECSSVTGKRLSKSFNRPHPVIQRAQLTSRVDSNLVRNRSTGDTSETTIAETELRSEIARSDKSRLSAFAGLRHEEELGARAGFNFSAPWIEARVDGRRNYQNQDTALIDLRSGFAVGGAGFSVAASRYESGVQMSVKGPEGNPVSVQVDRRSSATAESGKSAFVPLAGFSMYDVGIQPAKTRDVAYEQFTDRLIAYPGNIIQLARSVRPVTIIIGRLVHEDGTPVADAILQYDGTIGSTGADGYFQADGSPGDLVTARMAGHRSCEFTVPDQDAPVEIYFEVGELVCS